MLEPKRYRSVRRRACGGLPCVLPARQAASMRLPPLDGCSPAQETGAATLPALHLLRRAAPLPQLSEKWARHLVCLTEVTGAFLSRPALELLLRHYPLAQVRVPACMHGVGGQDRLPAPPGLPAWLQCTPRWPAD